MRGAPLYKGSWIIEYLLTTAGLAQFQTSEPVLVFGRPLEAQCKNILLLELLVLLYVKELWYFKS